MKLTTANLRQLIKEELEAVMQEGYTDKEILSQKVIDDFADGVINFTEFKEKIKVIGLSAYAEEQAMKAGVEALERKKQGKNTPFGDYIPGKNAPQFGTITDPLITTMKLSDDDKKKQKALQDRAQKIARELGGEEQFMKKMIDVSKTHPDVNYKTKEDVYADLMKIKNPNNNNQFTNVHARVEKFLDAIQPNQQKTPEKKPGFFSRFFKEE